MSLTEKQHKKSYTTISGLRPELEGCIIRSTDIISAPNVLIIDIGHEIKDFSDKLKHATYYDKFDADICTANTYTFVNVENISLMTRKSEESTLFFESLKTWIVEHKITTVVLVTTYKIPMNFKKWLIANYEGQLLFVLYKDDLLKSYVDKFPEIKNVREHVKVYDNYIPENKN